MVRYPPNFAVTHIARVSANKHHAIHIDTFLSGTHDVHPLSLSAVFPIIPVISIIPCISLDRGVTSSPMGIIDLMRPLIQYRHFGYMAMLRFFIPYAAKQSVWCSYLMCI